jgi:hypothetical protein
MSTYNWVKVLPIIILSFSCSKVPTLKDFDMESWKSDKNGCNKKRIELADKLISQKDKLLSLDEMEMVRAIGKPDRHEIYKRSEKFFYYSIDPASACALPTHQSRTLVVRFNAVGLAKEISVEEVRF